MRNSKHETAFINTFLLPLRRGRVLNHLGSKRKRSRFLNRLPHMGFEFFDEKYAIKFDNDPHDTGNIHKYLKDFGAPNICYIISEDPELDTKEMELKMALEKVVGMQTGSLISCIQGKLVYYEGEGKNNRFILCKKTDLHNKKVLQNKLACSM
jgi:hypothetical protein